MQVPQGPPNAESGPDQPFVFGEDVDDTAGASPEESQTRTRTSDESIKIKTVVPVTTYVGILLRGLTTPALRDAAAAQSKTLTALEALAAEVPCPAFQRMVVGNLEIM